ncbi:MAG: hypothetical protein ACREAE_03200 [Nitrosopumilaceae archaeon]
MASNGSEYLHEMYGNATAFLGGVTFTAFVLLIQSQEKFLYADWLIPSTAIVSFFLILATFGRVSLATSEKDNMKLLTTVATFTIIGFFGLMILIPFFILSFNLTGAIIVGIIELIGAFFFFRSFKR